MHEIVLYCFLRFVSILLRWVESIFIKKKQKNKQTKNSKKTPIIPLLGSQTKQNVHQLTVVEVKGNVALSLNVEIIRHPYRISSPTNGFVIELVEALERNLGCGSFNSFFLISLSANCQGQLITYHP